MEVSVMRGFTVYTYYHICWQESYERAKNILKTHQKEHKMLAEALLKYETLDAEDIKTIMSGESPEKAQPVWLPHCYRHDRPVTCGRVC